MEDVHDFARAGKLDEGVKVEDIEEGATLEYVSSTMKDPGEDYTAITLNGKQIGYWPGY
jgi:hypothetical protein